GDLSANLGRRQGGRKYVFQTPVALDRAVFRVDQHSSVPPHPFHLRWARQQLAKFRGQVAAVAGLEQKAAFAIVNNEGQGTQTRRDYRLSSRIGFKDGQSERFVGLGWEDD